MWEDTILPVAVLRTDWLLANDAGSIRTGDTVRVVTMARQAATESGEGETIWTSLDDWLVAGLITFVVVITIFLVGKHRARFALVGSAKVLCRLRWWPILCLDCVGGQSYIPQIAEVAR